MYLNAWFKWARKFEISINFGRFWVNSGTIVALDNQFLHIHTVTKNALTQCKAQLPLTIPLQ